MVLGTTLFGWLFLRSLVQIPNGYAIDVSRDPPAYAVGVDTDTLVAIPLPTSRFLGGGTVSLRYCDEDRPLGTGADAVNIRVEWRF